MNKMDWNRNRLFAGGIGIVFLMELELTKWNLPQLWFNCQDYLARFSIGRLQQLHKMFYVVQKLLYTFDVSSVQ